MRTGAAGTTDEADRCAGHRLVGQSDARACVRPVAGGRAFHTLDLARSAVGRRRRLRCPAVQAIGSGVLITRILIDAGHDAPAVVTTDARVRSVRTIAVTGAADLRPCATSPSACRGRVIGGAGHAGGPRLGTCCTVVQLADRARWRTWGAVTHIWSRRGRRSSSTSSGRCVVLSLRRRRVRPGRSAPCWSVALVTRAALTRVDRTCGPTASPILTPPVLRCAGPRRPARPALARARPGRRSHRRRRIGGLAVAARSRLGQRRVSRLVPVRSAGPRRADRTSGARCACRRGSSHAHGPRRARPARVSCRCGRTLIDIGTVELRHLRSCHVLRRVRSPRSSSATSASTCRSAGRGFGRLRRGGGHLMTLRPLRLWALAGAADRRRAALPRTFAEHGSTTALTPVLGRRASSPAADPAAASTTCTVVDGGCRRRPRSGRGQLGGCEPRASMQRAPAQRRGGRWPARRSRAMIRARSKSFGV